MGTPAHNKTEHQAAGQVDVGQVQLFNNNTEMPSPRARACAVLEITQAHSEAHFVPSTCNVPLPVGLQARACDTVMLGVMSLRCPDEA